MDLIEQLLSLAEGASPQVQDALQEAVAALQNLGAVFLSPPTTEASAFIVGEVFDAKTELPLSAAQVRLLDEESQGFVLTDSEGKYPNE